MSIKKVLVIGALGQLGTELTPALIRRYGNENVIAADLAESTCHGWNYVQLDVLDERRLDEIIRDFGITQVYLLAAVLSAKGEKDVGTAWQLNMQSLLSVLEIAQKRKLDKVFWPSSIAVFGTTSPKHHCPQHAVMDPTTVYGISKKAGEYWCNFYFENYGVDVRSLRFPGLIGYGALPGGGTTDYAVDIFHHAIDGQSYRCFLKEDTCLPMMYMPDAVRAVLTLMELPKEAVKVRTSYNIAGMSFSPCDLAAEITKHIPNFRITYQPDRRQVIADSWPASINDSAAQQDWGWQANFRLPDMVLDMVANLKIKNKIRYDADGCLHYPDDEYVFTRVESI